MHLIVVSKETLHLPLVPGATAGFPSPAADYIQGTIDLNEELIDHPEATYFVQVDGDSMNGANIPNGARLIVDRSLNAKSGDVIFAVINGEFTVKRLVKSGEQVHLKPENPKYKTITITEDMDFRVWGVVTYIFIDAKTV